MFLTRLREVRTERGLTIRELARASGVPYPAISLLENEKRKAQSQTIRKLAKALGVKTTELYDPQPGLQPPQPQNDNNGNNKPPSAARPPVKRQQKPMPKKPSFWVFERDRIEDQPFRVDTQAQAERIQAVLGGPHRAKVYEAVKSTEAWEQHVKFLTRIAQNLDYW